MLKTPVIGYGICQEIAHALFSPPQHSFCLVPESQIRLQQEQCQKLARGFIASSRGLIWLFSPDTAGRSPGDGLGGSRDPQRDSRARLAPHPPRTLLRPLGTNSWVDGRPKHGTFVIWDVMKAL